MDVFGGDGYNVNKFTRLRIPPLDSFQRDNQHGGVDVFGEVTQVVADYSYSADDGHGGGV
jgi:hypothetical protein